MMREYGGYLPIDSRGKEYFEFINPKHMIRLNAARYAILEAYQFGKFDKIWLPIYMCDSVKISSF